MESGNKKIYLYTNGFLQYHVAAYMDNETPNASQLAQELQCVL